MRWALIFIFIAVLLLLQPVEAHRLHVIYKINEIEIQAYYSGGLPCRDANVKVYDDNGNLHAQGVTDSQGKFRFPAKVGTKEYRVVVEAVHMPGHKAEITINLTQSVDLKKEMPLYSKILAGFGYLLGLAGIAMIYVSWKKSKEGRVRDDER